MMNANSYLYEKGMGTEVAADALGEEWKGCVVQVCDENDQQGFPMKQAVWTRSCVCLLLSCIEDTNLSVLNLVIVIKREKHIPGLPDTTVPYCRGPKRASRICKFSGSLKKMMSPMCCEKAPEQRR
ncbi:hypothetical protein HPG69_007676 [Diceros bicornis minor]|uniref:Small ribosomal subunit protein eS6 n=1 Tax=Diceros bicornis minor TaxID=77932 RepID=A0A7J7EAF1_DICBM|nr:hypothetical protein HPG69_007676 [Diceros bicornis minor]